MVAPRINLAASFAAAIAIGLLLLSRVAMAQAPGSYVDLHDFNGTVINADGLSGNDGYNPAAGVTFDRAGNMYGTTLQGGKFNDGIMWEITVAGVYKDLHDFGGTALNGVKGPDGTSPQSDVAIDASGNVYGVTTYGALNQSSSDPGDGMVWEITASGTYIALHDFGGTVVYSNGASGPDGRVPYGLSLDSSGNIFGTASDGGAYASANAIGGVLWEITKSGAYKDLHDFGGTVTNTNGTAPDGAGPEASLTFDGAGNMYGTTSNGGPHNAGVIWEMTTAGTYADLHDFGGSITTAEGLSGTDGSDVEVGVTLNSAGNMYGTSEYGGAYNVGLIWEFTKSGAYWDLYDFDPTLSTLGFTQVSSPSGVTFDGAGNMYGTTQSGGISNGLTADGDGVVWELESSETFNVIYEFGAGAIPASAPRGGVTFDSFGNMYGTDNDEVWKLVSSTSVCSYVPGLQMISLPYAYQNTGLDSLFNYTGAKLAAWDPITNNYAVTPAPAANSTGIGQGYWVRFPHTVMVTDAGTPAPTTAPFDIPLQAGWNLVGNPFTTPVPIQSLTFNNGAEMFDQATSSPNALIGGEIWAYNPNTNAYVDATLTPTGAAGSLNPYQGYWVFAYSATDMEVPVPITP